jgi:hypothetical protein
LGEAGGQEALTVDIIGKSRAGRFVLVHKANSIIQRDAIVEALQSEGLNPFTQERDVSKKVADGTLDLSYGGASAMFEGFPILVTEEEAARARDVVERVLASVREQDRIPRETDHLQKFYAMSLFSFLMIPVLAHAIGFYHLYEGIKKRQKINVVRFSAALIMYAAGGTLTWFMVASYF